MLIQRRPSVLFTWSVIALFSSLIQSVSCFTSLNTISTNNIPVPLSVRPSSDLAKGRSISYYRSYYHTTAGFISRQQQSSKQQSGSPVAARRRETLYSKTQLDMVLPVPASPAELLTTTLPHALRRGPCGVLALTAVASAVCIPATQIKNLYGISVGYGLSVATMALVLRAVFAVNSMDASMGHALTTGLVFYGIRLAAYLLVRDVSGWKSLDTKTSEPARWKRVPFAVSLALFYAFLVTPCLYALRAAAAAAGGGAGSAAAAAIDSAQQQRVLWKLAVGWTGAVLVWAGAVLEAVADTQKFASKYRHADDFERSAFHGPDTGVYAWTRHPNYTGEVAVWLGAYLAGLPSFGRSVVAWLCSTAGLYGIVSIMRSASGSLEKRHQEKYGGQEKYEAWKRKVPAPLVPFVKG